MKIYLKQCARGTRQIVKLYRVQHKSFAKALLCHEKKIKAFVSNIDAMIKLLKDYFRLIGSIKESKYIYLNLVKLNIILK